MGEIEAIARIVLTQTRVLVTLGAGILVMVPLAVMAARRLRWSRSRTLFAGMSAAGLALVPATTLARSDALVAWGRSCQLQPTLSSLAPEAVLNVILFVPAAFFGTLALRRFVPILASAAACSAVVEATQLVTGLGTCQSGDLVRNVAGSIVASGAAILLLRSSRGAPADLLTSGGG